MSTRTDERCELPNLVLKGKLAFLLLISLFLSVSFLNAQGAGIADYDLKSPADLSFAFDYDGSGHADHLVFYRPGTGIVYILADPDHDGNFTPVYMSNTGIGGYDLLSPDDRMFAFDYNGSGLLDHLVAYRPGTGAIWILSNTKGSFSAALISSTGLNDYDLRSTDDRVLAFDYNGNGLSDHLVFYRPGTGIIYIMQNTSGFFTDVYMSTNGIATYDLRSPSDRIFAFDLYGVGIADHLVAYRPGTGIVYLIENSQGSFGAIFQSTSGIGGYDLQASNDQLTAFDFTGNGNPDHLLAYRPGAGMATILQSSYFNFTPVYQSTTGIGGYDLMSTADKIFPYDYSSIGRADHLVCYRPGAGIIWILSNSFGTFTPVFSSVPTT